MKQFQRSEQSLANELFECEKIFSHSSPAFSCKLASQTLGNNSAFCSLFSPKFVFKLQNLQFGQHFERKTTAKRGCPSGKKSTNSRIDDHQPQAQLEQTLFGLALPIPIPITIPIQ